MKIKSYLLAGLATFALASCDESFNDWAEQATNTQGDAVAFGNGAVKPVDLIDFANVPEGQTLFRFVKSQQLLHQAMLLTLSLTPSPILILIWMVQKPRLRHQPSTWVLLVRFLSQNSRSM